MAGVVDQIAHPMYPPAFQKSVMKSVKGEDYAGQAAAIDCL